MNGSLQSNLTAVLRIAQSTTTIYELAVCALGNVVTSISCNKSVGFDKSTTAVFSGVAPVEHFSYIVYLIRVLLRFSK